MLTTQAAEKERQCKVLPGEEESDDEDCVITPVTRVDDPVKWQSVRIMVRTGLTVSSVSWITDSTR